MLNKGFLKKSLWDEQQQLGGLRDETYFWSNSYCVDGRCLQLAIPPAQRRDYSGQYRHERFGFWWWADHGWGRARECNLLPRCLDPDQIRRDLLFDWRSAVRCCWRRNLCQSKDLPVRAARILQGWHVPQRASGRTMLIQRLQVAETVPFGAVSFFLFHY